jgi:glutamate N-acetyltransferase/amino-acid N-acetyltransferase
MATNNSNSSNYEITAIPGCGLGTIAGIRCAGVSAGFRRNPNRKDLALIEAPEGAQAAAVFTTNEFAAAPVQVSRNNMAHLYEHNAPARAVVLNSGNANAATGEAGRETARATAKLTAEALGCEPYQVLVASTGVIGVPLPLDTFTTGVPAAIAALGAADATDNDAALAAAEAIMTTDTVPKQAAYRCTLPPAKGEQVSFTVAGICKGSGMIAPDMATMLAVLATDAPLTSEELDYALHEVVDRTFNKVTIDSDTSTNDSVFLFATGKASTNAEQWGSPSLAYDAFIDCLYAVCEDLARQIARDGEGASKLVTVNVTGAADEVDAEVAARAIAESPLVKTAIAGRDANWGRIAMAAGKSGAIFEQGNVHIDIMGIPVLDHGLPVPFSEEEAAARFEEPEIVLSIDLGAGQESCRMWTCDLTHDYISINADYRS